MSDKPLHLVSLLPTGTSERAVASAALLDLWFPDLMIYWESVSYLFSYWLHLGPLCLHPGCGSPAFRKEAESSVT